MCHKQCGFGVVKGCRWHLDIKCHSVSEQVHGGQYGFEDGHHLQQGRSKSLFFPGMKLLV